MLFDSLINLEARLLKVDDIVTLDMIASNKSIQILVNNVKDYLNTFLPK